MAIITFSRQMGASGDEIVRETAGSLSYTCVDKENIFGEAERYGLQREDLEKLDEKKPSLRDRIFRDRLSLYKNLLQSIIFQFAKNGDTIIVGGGAYFILKDVPGNLRVKIVAPLEDRIKRVMKESGVSRDGAISLISSSDSNRMGYMKHIFDTEWMDPTKYDLVLNTGRIGVADACRIITCAATSERMQKEGREALGLLRKLALARKVEAFLLTDKRIDSRYVSITVDEPGVVRLQGMVNSEGEKQIAGSLALSVEETVRVNNELVVTVVPVSQPEPM